MTEPNDENEMHEVSRLRFDCPHCGSFMKVRTSKTHLPEYRELYLHCTNEFKCGYRCKAALSVSETLAPSYCPNPDVDIKPSPWLMRRLGLEAQGQIRLGEFLPPKKESQQ
ncbi:ogr/Delta-like zinc finger family protein [Halomonas colorata]|uniref:ogr/Delta-like zinc finger family protein n=1 Tax=Halomonas colorata TaxID=2742615 RepID=UPI0018685316|nr:ogr/Delta-like zinc finger family protein [Halomonas colorata]